MYPFITGQLIKMLNQRMSVCIEIFFFFLKFRIEHAQIEANLLLLYETVVKWFCFWKGLSNYEYPGCVPGDK